MNIAERMAAKREGRKIIDRIEPKKVRRFSGRLIDVIAYRSNGETETFQVRSMKAANEKRMELIRQGFNRIDRIESRTRILDENNHRTNLTFTEKNYVPALVGRIPNPVVATDKKIANDRTKMALRNFYRKAGRNNEIKQSHNDKILIYSRIESLRTRTNKGRFLSLPKLIFSGTEDEASFFLLNTKLALSEMVIYLPEKMYREVNR